MAFSIVIIECAVMTCDHFVFLSVLNPHLSTKSLVLSDFWSGHKDEQVLLEAFGGKYVDWNIIPLQNMNNLWTCICSGNIKYKPREWQTLLNYVPVTWSQNCTNRFFIMKLHSVICNQLSAETYRPMLRYAWQNAGFDSGEPVDNFTGVIDVAFCIDIIECAVLTCDHFAFLHCLLL